MKLIMSKRSSMKLSQRFFHGNLLDKACSRRLFFLKHCQKGLLEAPWHVTKVFDMATFLRKLVQGGDLHWRSFLKLFGMLQRFLTWQPSWNNLFKEVVLLKKSVFLDPTFLGQIWIWTGSGSGPRPFFRSNPFDKACSKRCFTSKISVSGSDFFGVDLYFSDPDPHLIWIHVICKNLPNFKLLNGFSNLKKYKLLRILPGIHWHCQINESAAGSVI